MPIWDIYDDDTSMDKNVDILTSVKFMGWNDQFVKRWVKLCVSIWESNGGSSTEVD